MRILALKSAVTLSLVSSLFLWLVQTGSANDLDPWISFQGQQSLSRMFANISPPGTAPGAVIASPSHQNPDYFFHWVRDSALTMNVVVSLFEAPGSNHDRLLQILVNYVDFSRRNQMTANRSGPAGEGLGEPAFAVDGSPLNRDWGRPQNDGPALRSITLIRLARILLAQGNGALVSAKLYDGKNPSMTVIKTDLDFLVRHWREPSFDLWEETRGDHFYTEITQRRALVEGAKLALQLGDPAAAQVYREQAALIEAQVMAHWNPERGYFLATLNANGGLAGKNSGLDVAVILGVLHAIGDDGFLAPNNVMVLATAAHIEASFNAIYPINQNHVDASGAALGAAIGRYPEDRYNGYATDQLGNPWVLATAAFAELYYRSAGSLARAPEIKVTPKSQGFLEAVLRARHSSLSASKLISRNDPRFALVFSALRDKGDQYLRRIKFHANPDGSLSEEMDRNSGFMTGADNLTWSYASFLTAVAQRPGAQAVVGIAPAYFSGRPLKH